MTRRRRRNTSVDPLWVYLITSILFMAALTVTFWIVGVIV